MISPYPPGRSCRRRAPRRVGRVRLHENASSRGERVIMTGRPDSSDHAVSSSPPKSSPKAILKSSPAGARSVAESIRGYGRLVAGSSFAVSRSSRSRSSLQRRATRPTARRRTPQRPPRAGRRSAPPGVPPARPSRIHQVAAGVFDFSARNVRAEAVDLAERCGGRLEVELAGLRQVTPCRRRVGREQRRGALARRRVRIGSRCRRSCGCREVADPEQQLVTHPHHPRAGASSAARGGGC